MASWQIAVLLLLLLQCTTYCTVSRPIATEIGHFIEESFGVNRELNTVILWGLSSPILAVLDKNPRPRYIIDRASGLKQMAQENCLIIMELTADEKYSLKDLLKIAFMGTNNHHKAKYLILIKSNRKLTSNLRIIGHHLDHVRVIKYIILVFDEVQGKLLSSGYVSGKKYIETPICPDYRKVYRDRLQNSTLRGVATESVPYTFRDHQGQLSGMDVEITKTILQMMGVSLSDRIVKYALVDWIMARLANRTADMYLTRRGCTGDSPVPQLHLHDPLTTRLLMPRSHHTNYNLQFLKPYKPEAWYGLITALLVVCLLNWLFWKHFKVNLLLVLVFGHYRTSSRLTAVLVVVMQSLKFILFEAYLTQVTSFMIRLRYGVSLETLEEFFESNILLNHGWQAEDYISGLPGDLPGRMQAKLTHSTVWPHVPGYAYIVTEYASEKMDNEFGQYYLFNSSMFYILAEPLHTIRMCYCFARWSQFLEKFGELLQRLYETGLVAKLSGDVWRVPRNGNDNVNSSPVLEFGDLVPVFLFMCYGAAAAMVVFLLELAFKRIETFYQKWQWSIHRRPRHARRAFLD